MIVAFFGGKEVFDGEDGGGFMDGLSGYVLMQVPLYVINLVTMIGSYISIHFYDAILWYHT